MHIKTTHISKLYNDDTGRFTVISRTGNQYIMVAYHCDSNTTMAVPFKSRKDKDRMVDYNTIMQRLKDRNILLNLQILDNEASNEYKTIIKDKWNIKYQLVPSHIHLKNAAERSILTFKAHFLSILAGVVDDFPCRHWDQLLPQAELTPILLRQARIQPELSAWTYLMGAFNYDANPLGPLGCPVMIHNKTSNRKSWYFRSKEGWSVGVSFENYRFQLVIPVDTREINVYDTVEFIHQFITTSTLTPEDRILHRHNTLSSAIKDRHTATYEAQIQAITKLWDICTGWAGIDTPRKSKVHELTSQRRRSPRLKNCNIPRRPNTLQGCQNTTIHLNQLLRYTFNIRYRHQLQG